jgi:subtilisin family serine protease
MTKVKLLVVLAVVTACTEPIEPERVGPATQTANGGGTRYVIVFNQPHALPQNVESIVANAGGAVAARLDEIGSLAATSPDPDFAAKIASHPTVQAVSVDVEVQMIPGPADLGAIFVAADATETPGPAEPAGPDPQPGPLGETLYPQQWDKMRMNASASPTGSYTVQRGRPDVVVAILDSGIEITHPDLLPNLDFGRSRSFVGGVADPNPAAWDDKNGHGSWCASAVGAAINQFGIAGVAPEVTIVALKVLNDAGSGSYFWLAQALVYSGVNKFDVASMSLGGYLRHAAGFQTALVTVLQRSIEFARANGVTPVAALGNDNFDLGSGEFSVATFGIGDVFEAPGEMAGVIGVSATGYLNQKAYYSNYGVHATDVAAPGGDRRYQDPPPFYHGGGRVLGAWAAEPNVRPPGEFREEECEVGPGGACSYYAWIQGTSMAAPNAAGVVALIISQYGDFTADNSQKLHMSPTRVEAILQITANNQPCPEPNTVVYPLNVPPRPPGVFQGTATCNGGAGGYTGFYGKGIVDAWKAVTAYAPTLATNP